MKHMERHQEVTKQIGKLLMVIILFLKVVLMLIINVLVILNVCLRSL